MLFSYVANQQYLISVVSILYFLIHIHIYDLIVMYSKSALEMFFLVHIQVTCTKNLISSSASFRKEKKKPQSALSQPTMETVSTFNSRVFWDIMLY